MKASRGRVFNYAQLATSLALRGLSGRCTAACWEDGPCLTKGGIAAWIARSSVETACTPPAFLAVLLADAFLGVSLGMYAVNNRPAGCAPVLEPFLPARLSSQ